MRDQPEHLRPGNPPSYWSSGLPRPEHMLPDRAQFEAEQAKADRRERGYDIAMVGRRLSHADRLGGGS